MVGIDDAIGAVSGLFKTILDKFAPDANAKIALQQAHDAEVAAAAQQAASIEAAKYTADIDLLKRQLDVNLAEASNSNLFISGARPFAMWSLVILVELLSVAFFVAVYTNHDVTGFLEIFFTLVSLLCTLLGVHTIERHRGVAPEQPDGPNVPKAVSVAESIALPKISSKPAVSPVGEKAPLSETVVTGIATVFGLNYDGSKDPGDNGEGAWGVKTDNKEVLGVSLPEAVLILTFGLSGTWRQEAAKVREFLKLHNVLVHVKRDGKTVIAPVVDVGPARTYKGKLLHNAIDLTYAAAHALETNGEAVVSYQIVSDGLAVPIKGWDRVNGCEVALAGVA